MSHKKLRPFIVKVSVLGYFPLHMLILIKSVMIMYLIGTYYKSFK